MRHFLRSGGRLAATALLLGLCGPLQAAGIQSIQVPAQGSEPELSAMVWTPCAQPGGTVALGSFVLAGQRNCAVAGEQLPLVLISHGDSGSAIGHHDTAAALADAGFVVAAVSHPGNNFADNSRQTDLSIFVSRPRDLSRLLDFMTQSWPEHGRLNPTQTGVFGFSRGGYTALALIGAVPDKQASHQRFCAPWWSFVLGLCRQLRDDALSLQPVADARFRAAVVVDPLNLFADNSFSAVRTPVQLWASELGGDGVELAHIEAIKRQLPQPPDYQLVRGAGHFVFLSPCPPALAAEASDICTDPAGIDRVDFHQQLNRKVVAFFRQHLQMNVQMK